MSQGATVLDLLMGSASDLRRFVTLRLNTVYLFEIYSLTKNYKQNETKSKFVCTNISHRVKLQVTTCVQFEIIEHNYSIPFLPTLIIYI